GRRRGQPDPPEGGDHERHTRARDHAQTDRSVAPIGRPSTGDEKRAIGWDQEKIGDAVAVGRRTEREGRKIDNPSEHEVGRKQPQVAQPEPGEEEHGPRRIERASVLTKVAESSGRHDGRQSQSDPPEPALG
ncbi:MAG: hypothetical protein ACK55I_49375, partial [bacterium]